MTWGQLVVGIISAMLVAVGTIYGAWKTGQIGRASVHVESMDQQRKTFESMLAPLQQQVTDLRSRVDSLEREVRTERDLRERIVSYARTVLWSWRRQFPDHPPPAPPESIASHFD